MRFRRTFLILLLSVAAPLAPRAWAYINGGDFHSTLKGFEGNLKAAGWGVSFEAPLPADYDRTKEIRAGVKVDPPDNPEFQRYVGQLVARAIQSLPKKDANQIPADEMREVVRLAGDAIRSAVANKQQVIKEGHAGALQYRAGASAFESYWETNYRGRREIHAKRSGLAPFVALRIAGAKGTDKPAP